MLTSDTKRRIDSCRDILVGKLPLPTDQVELITLALIYKFMDDLDEESVAMGGRRSFFTGPLAPYRWRELMSQTLSAEERMTRFADGLELLGGGKKLRLPKKSPKKNEEPTEEVDVAAHLPALFRDIFRNAFLKFRDGRILTLFLTELSGFAYSHSEELGNAFEYILSVMGAQGDNGQFRTPRHVIDFMVACLDPQPGQTVLDPACGTGGFLVSAFRHILLKHTSPSSTVRGDRLTHTQRQQLYAAFTGYDINDQMVKLSRVNLFLHDFATPQIHIYDTLTNDARWPEKYDLILANPPFMTPKGGVVPHTRFRVPAKKSEVLFTDYIAEHLTPDGRAGIVVPNGIVATTQTAYVKLRRFLVEESLVAVVSLPAGCFKPYSGVKTSILLLDKKLARTTDKILFLKIAADGFDLGDKRTPIEANDLPEAERVIRAWLTGKLGDDFASPLAWKVVDKAVLQKSAFVNLEAEEFVGGSVSIAPKHYTFDTTTIGEVAKVVSGHGFPLQFQGNAEAEIPFYKVSDMNLRGNERLMVTHNNAISRETLGTLKGRAHPAGTIIFPKVGAAIATNKKRMLTRESTFDNNVMGIVPGPSIEPKFLLGLLQAFDLSKWASESHPPSMRQSVVESQEIPLPPLEEQRRIVAEIEGYQQVIDGARQILAAYRPQLEVDPEWESAQLSDVVSTITPPKKILTTGFAPTGRYPIIDQSQDAIAGRTDDESALIDAAGGLVIFGDHTCAVKFVAEPFAQGADGIKILRPTEKLLSKFLYFYLVAHPLEQIGYQRHFSKLKTVQIPLPPKPEQERIVAELEAEAAKVEAVRGLVPLYEAKIQRTLARVWGHS